MFSKSALSITMVLALALTSSVNAVELTDGSISRTGIIGGTSFSLEGPGLSFSGSFDNFSWQSTPCTPCFSGEPESTSNRVVLVTIDLSSNTVVTIDGTTFRNWGSLSGVPPLPFAILTSSMEFSGGVVEVPFSDEPDLVLIAPFTMSGGVGGRWGFNNLFAVDFTGSGFVSLHVKRIEGSSRPAYIFQAITYKIAKEINIDVKPGDDSNFINTRSGKTSVAILSTADFDAATVNPLSISLAGAPVSLKKNGTTASSLEDVNGDGLLDLVVHVSTQALQLNNPNQVLLEGDTISGEPLWASDEIIMVP